VQTNVGRRGLGYLGSAFDTSVQYQLLGDLKQCNPAQEVEVEGEVVTPTQYKKYAAQSHAIVLAMNITSPRPQSPASSVRSPQVPQSPSLASASSVRPSLDVPAGIRSSSPAPGNPAQRRNRAALRDYYNLKAKGQSVQTQNLSRTASITSATSDGTVTSSAAFGHDTASALPSELDDLAFDAETYVRSLLKSSSLTSILRTEATLISEIKNLDGERKALVYDNYSKLIKATQTIGNMQQGLNARNIGDMEMLQPAVEGIGKLAEELDRLKSGDEGEGRIRREKQKRELVRWVVGAPPRFQSYVEEGKREEMESEWKGVSKALKKWRGVKGADQIRRECEEIMGVVTDDVG
jgi:hypothetical protein